MTGGIDEWLTALNQKKCCRNHGSRNTESRQRRQRAEDQQDAANDLGQHCRQCQPDGNAELGGELRRVHQLAASVLNESNPDE